MANEISKLKRNALKGAKGRRLPKDRNLSSELFDYVARLLGFDPKRVPIEQGNRHRELSEGISIATGFYFMFSDMDAVGPVRPRQRGRPRHNIDFGFVLLMARALHDLFGEPGIRFRIYQNARKKMGEIGGTERPSLFQVLCNEWMMIIDPERPSPIKPSVFKAAGYSWQRRPKNRIKTIRNRI